MRLVFVSFYWFVEFCGCRGDDFIARKEFTQEFSQASWGSVYKTLVQYIRLAERTAGARFCSSWATARLFKGLLLCHERLDARQHKQLQKWQAEQQAGKNHKDDAHGLEMKALSNRRNQKHGSQENRDP